MPSISDEALARLDALHAVIRDNSRTDYHAAMEKFNVAVAVSWESISARCRSTPNSERTAPTDEDGFLRDDLEAVAGSVYSRFHAEISKRGINLPGCDTTDKCLEVIERFCREVAAPSTSDKVGEGFCPEYRLHDGDIVDSHGRRITVIGNAGVVRLLNERDQFKRALNRQIELTTPESASSESAPTIDRDAIIEECAKVIDARVAPDGRKTAEDYEAIRCANVIRALKNAAPSAGTTPPPASVVGNGGAVAAPSESEANIDRTLLAGLGDELEHLPITVSGGGTQLVFFAITPGKRDELVAALKGTAPQEGAGSRAGPAANGEPAGAVSTAQSAIAPPTEELSQLYGLLDEGRIEDAKAFIRRWVNSQPRLGDVLDSHDEGLERAARVCEGTANALKPDMCHQRDALLIVASSIRELKRAVSDSRNDHG